MEEWMKSVADQGLSSRIPLEVWMAPGGRRLLVTVAPGEPAPEWKRAWEFSFMPVGQPPKRLTVLDRGPIDTPRSPLTGIYYEHPWGYALEAAKLFIQYEADDHRRDPRDDFNVLIREGHA